MKKLLFFFTLFSLVSFVGADTHNAASGAYDDIQAAVDAASDGDIVLIPAGVYDFGEGNVEILDKLIHIRGAGIAATTLQKTSVDTSYKQMIRCFMRNVQGGPIVSDMKLIDTNGPYGVNNWDNATVGLTFEYGCWDFRAYNMEFENFGYAGIMCEEYIGVEEWLWKQRGVISDCNFIDNFMPGLAYGVYVLGSNTRSWEEDIAMGNAYNVFIEDCYFTGHRHHVAANYGGRYVCRYNTMDSCDGGGAHSIDAHGRYYGHETLRGTVSFEIYENTIGVPAGGERAIGIRGGTGVIYNNSFDGFDDAIYPMIDGCHSGGAGYPCSYPVPDQIYDVYIWGNYYTDCDYEFRVSPDIILLIMKDRDYFLEPLPGYVPFQYPHPDREEGSILRIREILRIRNVLRIK